MEIKFLLAFGIAVLFSGYGYADVTDSGNLNLGGQAVVGGTMTVTGNAFSVGGSTLAVKSGQVGIGTSTPAANLDVNGNAQFGSGVTKSTFTSTGLLKLTASGIQWADGSTSTTTANGGGAPTGGNNTWTGTNTFQSTFRITGTAGGLCTEVAMSSGTAITALTSGNVVIATTSYRLHFEGIVAAGSSSASAFKVVFSTQTSANMDTGSHYSYWAFAIRQNGNTLAQDSSSTSGIALGYEAGNNVNAKDYVMGDYWIGPVFGLGGNGQTLFNGSSTASHGSLAEQLTEMIGGYYNSNSPITAVGVQIISETSLTGRMILYQCSP